MTCAAVTVCALVLAGTTWSPDQSQVQIIAGVRCAAEVHILNRWNDNPIEADGAVTLGPLAVGIHAFIGQGYAPDTFTAFPPDGYVAIPESVTLEEGRAGVIEICEFQGA
jgi:hypothetical protein